MFDGNLITQIGQNNTIVIIENPIRSAELLVPAVTSDKEGMIVSLMLEIKPGTGKTIVNIDDLTFWSDTQDSIRTAKKVASNVTGSDMSKYDVMYTIGTDASAIEGPSAGAALSIATVLALEDIDSNYTISITGALDDEGNILQVGGVSEKAHALENNNMTIFLVPDGQRYYVEKEVGTECEPSIFGQTCHVVSNETTIDIQEQVNVEIIEVSDIQEALLYFI